MSKATTKIVRSTISAAAITVVASKRIANTMSSFIKDVKEEVNNREQVQEEPVFEPNQSSMRDFVNKGDVEC